MRHLFKTSFVIVLLYMNPLYSIAQCPDEPPSITFQISDNQEPQCYYGLSAEFTSNENYPQVTIEYTFICYDVMYTTEDVIENIIAGGTYQSTLLGVEAECACDISATLKFTELDGSFNYCGPYEAIENSIVVPVSLRSFEISDRGQHAEASWETSSEINASHFEVQFSQNGKQFNTIQQTKAYNKASRYNSIISNRSGYYRLKSIDRDGYYEYSDTEHYHANSNIRIQANVIMLEEAQRVSVYDMNGRLLYDDKTSFLDVNQLGHFGLKLVRIQDVIFKTL